MVSRLDLTAFDVFATTLDLPAFPGFILGSDSSALPVLDNIINTLFNSG